MSDQYYIIEKVVDRKTIDGRTKVLIKWEGYPTKYNSWEWESEVIHDADIETLTKSINPMSTEEKKMVTVDKVLTYIRSGRRIEGNRNDLFKAVKEHPGGAIKEDGIWIYLKDKHYYVILAHKDIGNFICDGQNLCKNGSKRIKEFERELGRKLVYIEDGQEQKNDYHCGAHAVWLALNLLADTKNGDKPELIINKRLPSLTRFINRLYNE